MYKKNVVLLGAAIMALPLLFSQTNSPENIPMDGVDLVFGETSESIMATVNPGLAVQSIGPHLVVVRIPSGGEAQIPVGAVPLAEPPPIPAVAAFSPSVPVIKPPSLRIPNLPPPIVVDMHTPPWAFETTALWGIIASVAVAVFVLLIAIQVRRYRMDRLIATLRNHFEEVGIA